MDHFNQKEFLLKKRLQDFMLTPKEVWLAISLYKKMRSNKELAYELDLSINTITGRMSAIYEKLNIKTRSQLIIKLSEMIAMDKDKHQ